MTTMRKILFAAAAVLALAVLNSCLISKPNPKLYLLSTPQQTPVAAAVRIASVSLPAHLSGNEIVRINSDGTVAALPGGIWCSRLETLLKEELDRAIEPAGDAAEIRLRFTDFAPDQSMCFQCRGELLRQGKAVPFAFSLKSSNQGSLEEVVALYRQAVTELVKRITIEDND